MSETDPALELVVMRRVGIKLEDGQCENGRQGVTVAVILRKVLAVVGLASLTGELDKSPIRDLGHPPGSGHPRSHPGGMYVVCDTKVDTQGLVSGINRGADSCRFFKT